MLFLALPCQSKLREMGSDCRFPPYATGRLEDTACLTPASRSRIDADHLHQRSLCTARPGTASPMNPCPGKKLSHLSSDECIRMSRKRISRSLVSAEPLLGRTTALAERRRPKALPFAVSC